MTAVVRVGVTGHRTFLDDPADLDAAVDAVLDRVAPDGSTVELWTSLAEGADRIVAERAQRRPGTRVVAVLPLDADDYAEDFEGAPSKAAFADLLAGADEVHVAEHDLAAGRDAAYESAGHAVVDGCDVLVALWDGEPSRGRGGTAEIVEHARARGIPVEVIPVRR